MSSARIGLAPARSEGRRRATARAGVRIEIFTVVWMTVEAAVAIGAGVLARSVLLTAFGIDSVIELIAGGALLIGLALNALAHWWWADAAAALIFLVWLVPEAREALESARSGRGGCACGDARCTG